MFFLLLMSLIESYLSNKPKTGYTNCFKTFSLIDAADAAQQVSEKIQLQYEELSNAANKTSATQQSDPGMEENNKETTISSKSDIKRDKKSAKKMSQALKKSIVSMEKFQKLEKKAIALELAAANKTLQATVSESAVADDERQRSGSGASTGSALHGSTTENKNEYGDIDGAGKIKLFMNADGTIDR